MFSQEFCFNIRTCDGCACRCLLGTAPKDGENVFMPTINGRVIPKWIDADGKERSVSSVTAGAALAQARDIVKCCDYYKTDMMPRAGAVKCAQCSLPDDMKCDLIWMPYVLCEDLFYAHVEGTSVRFGRGVPRSVDGETPVEALNNLRVFISDNCVHALCNKVKK